MDLVGIQPLTPADTDTEDDLFNCLEKIKQDPAACFPCHAYRRHWHRSWYRSVRHLATSVWSSRNAVVHCLPSMDSVITIQDINTTLTEFLLFLDWEVSYAKMDGVIFNNKLNEMRYVVLSVLLKN